jgi:hypothetical protein
MNGSIDSSALPGLNTFESIQATTKPSVFQPDATTAAKSLNQTGTSHQSHSIGYKNL